MQYMLRGHSPKIIKISTHPCYPRNFDRFSWGMKQNKIKIDLKQAKNTQKNALSACSEAYIGQPDKHKD